MHMYVWSRASLFYAVAQAESVEKARAALLEEIEGEGATDAHKDAMEWIRNQGPSIWHGQNSEFALTDSVELRLSDENNSELREEIKNLKQQLAQAQASLAAARAQALEEAAKIVQAKSELFIHIGDDNQALDALAWSSSAIRALITPSDSTALAKLLAKERLPLGDALKLIRGFVTQYNLAGLRAHKDSMNPGEDLLWKAQEFLAAARVAELKGEQPKP